MQQINVEKIMDQIKSEIKEKGYTEDMFSFQDIPLDDTDYVEEMKGTAFIDWHQPVSKGIKGFLKKVIQKCIAFSVAPIAEGQTRFNSTAISAIEELYLLIEEQRKEIDKQRKMILNLKGQLQQQKVEI